MTPALEQRTFKLLIRIEAEVTLTDDGDPRGSKARFVVAPEMLMIPQVPPLLAKTLVAKVMRHATGQMQKEPVLWLDSPTDSSSEMRAWFEQEKR